MSALTVQRLADCFGLGELLDTLRACVGPFDLHDHWKQGEFHHDVVVVITATDNPLPGRVLVVATNCNGGIKEVLAFDDAPDRWALWHWRCPHVSDFGGALPPVLARAVTPHWFDPCELLKDDARSELRAEHRQRQEGGGWEMAPVCRK